MYRKSALALFLFLLVAVRPAISLAQTGATLTTDPSSLTMGVTQLFVTDLVVNTGDNQIGGVGAILLYDPAIVNVDHIETGTTFSDYPLAAFDNETGRVAVSGVVGSPDQLITGVHAFAKVYWKAMSEGDAVIRYEFAPNSTTDSNVAVTTGSGDALSAVTELPVTVVTDAQPGAVTDDQNTGGENTTDDGTVVMAETPEPTAKPFLARAGSFVNNLLGREESTIDPDEPLTQQAPKTTFGEAPEATEEPGSSGTGIAGLLPIVLIIVVLAVILVLIIRMLKRRKPGGGEPAEAAHVMTEVAAPPAPQPLTPVQPQMPTAPTPSAQPTAPVVASTPPPSDGPVLTRM